MKKNLICAALMLCALLMLCAAEEDEEYSGEYTEGDFQYTVTDDSVTITGYFGSDRDVQVPSSIAGLPVNTIGEGAFDNPGVSSVTLPGSVTTVEEGAIGENVNVSFGSKPTATPSPAPTATPTPTAPGTWWTDYDYSSYYSEEYATPTPRPTAKPTAKPTARPTAKPTPTPKPRAEDAGYEEAEGELTAEEAEAARLLAESAEAAAADTAYEGAAQPDQPEWKPGGMLSAAAVALGLILAVCRLLM